MKILFQISLFVVLLISGNAFGKHIVIIKNPEQPKSEKEALLVLNGLGESGKGLRHQKKFFGQYNYDLYIPDYIKKKSFNLSKEIAVQFFEDQKLTEYKAVHIVSFILGGFSMNPYINEKGEMNIKTIVYDRSPIQERAPVVVHDKIPFLGRLVAGKLLREFAATPYPPIENGDINIGIIVETKATSLMRKFEKATYEIGPLDWENPDLNQEYDDLIYTHLDHDEMYVSFDEIGDEIMYFIENGKFPENARREHYNWDPFVPYRKEKKN